MSVVEKQFVLTYVFKNVASIRDGTELYSPNEEHFGVPWKINGKRNKEHLALFLHCLPEKTDNDWSIEVWREGIIRSKDGKTHSKASDVIFKSTEWNGLGWSDFIKWEDLMKEYVVNATLEVEFHVKIKRMTGINLRNFGETNRMFSDFKVTVETQQFYVSKLFLVGQSQYFKKYILKAPEHSQAVLYNVKSTSFQKFLEASHGDPAIDDTTVDEIFSVSIQLQAPNTRRQCEEFLIQSSKKSLKEKWNLAKRYRLLNLKTHCLASMESPADVASVLPADLGQMDRSELETLFKKLCSFDHRLFQSSPPAE